MIRCPECGAKLDLAEIILTERQQSVRNAIERIRRETGRWPYAREIGAIIGYTDRAMRYELARMESLGVVCRPSGPRSGWALRREHLTVIRAS
jgi:hypothetical protein